VIVCPVCGGKTEVRETRHSRAGVRRRRFCMSTSCAGKLTTVEVVVPDDQKAAELASGTSILIAARQLKRLQKIVASLGGGDV
jgi:hypothetical protein